MSDFIEQIQRVIPQDIFTDLEVAHLVSGSRDRRYGVMKRAMASGKIINLRRGLYCFAEPYRRHPLNLFSIAQYLYPPSYMSLESALAYHGWIPESVQTTTSVAQRRSCHMNTPMGMFHYYHLQCEPFFAGVTREWAESGAYFMATPWKAVVDYVVAYKKEWRGIYPLIHSLRIDEEQLHDTTQEALAEIEVAYAQQRVRRFLKEVRKDLRL